ncbi:hypothetical protein C8R45DRAFT_990480 [Mycena sanguinolenta]|nr:hypothetical protein C8R45DRAFT_990480 [Mycena sanguinolenta]
MYHPYSAAASYIYANGTTHSLGDLSSSQQSLDAHQNDPNRMIRSVQSADSLPLSSPYSPQNTMTWTTDNTWMTDDTFTQNQFSEDDWPSERGSKGPLLTARRRRIMHPYSQPTTSWIDEEPVPEMPVFAKSKSQVVVATGTKEPVPRKPAFVPYEPRPFEDGDRERQRERDKARLSASWRRKIQRRVKRALRRLKRFLEGL